MPALDEDEHDDEIVDVTAMSDATVAADDAQTMLAELLDFLFSRGGVATTAELSQRFASYLQGAKAFCFRQLLRETAMVKNGVWKVGM